MPKFRVGEKLRGIIPSKEKREEKLKKEAFLGEVVDEMMNTDGYNIILKPAMDNLKIAAEKKIRGESGEERARLFGMIDFYNMIDEKLKATSAKGKDATKKLKN